MRALHWSEDSVTAHFKRHLAPTRITGKGHELLRLIECNRRVNTDTLIADMQPVARMLVEERLVGVSTDVA